MEGFVYRSENEWKLFQEGFLEEEWLVNEGWVGLSWREMKKPQTKHVKHTQGKKLESGKRGLRVGIDEGNHYSFSTVPTLLFLPKSFFNLDCF